MCVRQALPERRHLVIATVGKLKISLNDVGMSAGYLAPAIAQIMARYKVRFRYSGCSSAEFWKPLWMKSWESLWEATESHGDFFKCLIRISLASLFGCCPLSFHCASLKKSVASSSWQCPLDSRGNYPFWITSWYSFERFVAIAYRSVSWRAVVFRLLQQGSDTHPQDFVKIFKKCFLLD